MLDKFFLKGRIIRAFDRRNIDLSSDDPDGISRALTEGFEFFGSKGVRFFGTKFEKWFTDKASWFEVIQLAILLEVKSKGIEIKNAFDTNTKALIAEWFLNKKGGIIIQWTSGILSSEKSDIPFDQIFDFAFGKGFSEYLYGILGKTAASLMDTYIVFHLKKYAEESLSILRGKAFFEALKICREIDRDKKKASEEE